MPQLFSRFPAALPSTVSRRPIRRPILGEAGFQKVSIETAELKITSLAGSAFGHSSLSHSQASEPSEIIVGTDQTCPRGTQTHVPAYLSKAGKLVHVGTLCKSLTTGN